MPVMYQAPLQNCWDVVVDKARPSPRGVYTPVRKSNDQPGHSENVMGERIMLRGGTVVGRKLYSIGVGGKIFSEK